MRHSALCLVVVVLLVAGAALVAGRVPADEQSTVKKTAADAGGTGQAGAGVLRVKSTADFDVTGDGRNEHWSKTEWQSLPRRTENGLPYESRIKLLHSPTGLYILFDATDKKLSAAIDKDFENLWTEDVFEVFLWTDEQQTTYFEYEISPLGKELPILVPNFDGKFLGWLPWHYEGGRKTRIATAAAGGEKKSGSVVTGWSAEIFIPYELLKPLPNVPPKPGTHWRTNFYRVDYDEGRQTRWTWVPVGPGFHEFRKFGTLVFE